MTTLFLMCGLPGAGKTTRALSLAQQVPAIRLCPDEWMVALGIDLFDESFRGRLEIVFWQQAQDLLRLGQSVILESGFWLRSDRDEKRLGARALLARVELHYLSASLDELHRRIAARGTVRITREMLSRYTGLFQAPDSFELALFDVTTPVAATEANDRSTVRPHHRS